MHLRRFVAAAFLALSAYIALPAAAAITSATTSPHSLAAKTLAPAAEEAYADAAGDFCAKSYPGQQPAAKAACEKGYRQGLGVQNGSNATTEGDVCDTYAGASETVHTACINGFEEGSGTATSGSTL